MMRSFKFVRTASSKLQFKINQSIIFNYLRANGPISRAKISQDLKISAPAVSRVIEKLINDGYVIETCKQETKSGKRPTLLALNKDRGFVLGVDLGSEKLKMALMDFSGKIVKNCVGPDILDQMDITEVLKCEIAGFFKEAAKNFKKDSINSEIKSICLAFPADIDPLSGKIISAPLYGSWGNINLKEDIKKAFNIPVFIENNVNLAAWGEKINGKAKNCSNMVFLEISNGIKAGIIVNNALIKGQNGYAGEVGFTITGTSNLGFKTDDKGYLERSASITSIADKAVLLLKEGHKSVLTDMVKNNIDEISPSIICEAASKNDKLSKDIIDNAVRLLSIAVINLVLILNPKIIVLGGYLCNLPYRDELFVKPMKNYIKKTIPFVMPDIEISEFKDEAAIIGSCLVAMESLLLGEFPYKIE